VLRFLFEDENYGPHNPELTQIVNKTHHTKMLDKNGIYIFTVRNPVDACASLYRVQCSGTGRIAPVDVLDGFVKEQKRSARFLKKLTAKKADIIVLKYEEFVSDFDAIFTALERKFCITIDDQDKCFLKEALSRENVNKNIAKFDSFAQHDEYSLFRGKHIDQGEFSKELKERIQVEIKNRLSKYSDLFRTWGYDPLPEVP
jgi:hypothetical protein